MSYLPRPPAVPDEKSEMPGRADEVWSISGAFGSNSAGTQNAFGRLPNSTPNRAGSIKLPPSTRASMFKGISSDTQMPKLPPLPVFDPTGASTTKPSTGAGAAPQASSLHRRTASAGDERHSAPKLPHDTLELATDNPPRPKSRLGLANLRLVWPHSKNRPAKNTANALGERTRWTPNEAHALAKACLYFWKSGRPVDYALVSAELGRSPKDIAEMLEHTLEGYAQFGGVSCWDAQSQSQVMRWAAAEFPANPLLSPDRTREANTVSRLDMCLSALTCRPRSVSKDLAYALDSPDITTSGQNVVADFREGMRERKADYFSQNPTPAGTNPTTPGNADTAKEEKQQSSLSGFDAIAAAVAADPGLVGGANASLKGSTQSRSRSRSSSTIPQSSSGVPSTRAGFVPVTEPNAQPLFTGGLRNKQGLNTVNRETRARRARKSSFKVENGSRVNGATSPSVSTPFTFSSPLAPVDAVSLSSVGAPVPANGTPRVSGRARSSTVALPHTPALTSRTSRDSGNVESHIQAIPDVPALDGLERSPELLRPVVGEPHLEAELDVQFDDLSGDFRAFVRNFVSRYIHENPGDFQKRVEAQKRGNDGLCIVADQIYGFRPDDAAAAAATEKVHRENRGGLAYTSNMLFHQKLWQSIRPYGIQATDAIWNRISEFATEVFNERIEDQVLVVMQERRNSISEPAHVYNPVDSSSYTAETRGRYESLLCNEMEKSGSPYERAFGMDVLARENLRFLMDNYRDDIHKRARDSGMLPMPVALQVDHEKMLQFDIDVRSEIIRFIWQEIPASSSESKEIALLRTLELLNGEIAVLRGLYEAILPRIMNDRNVDGLEDEDRDIADPEVLNGVPNSQLAQVVGREFARTHFNELKCVFLEAMIHNHPFRPLYRDELKEWRVKGESPFGRDVDYLLNSSLYDYIRRLDKRRPSSKQWLETSAAATLSMMRRTINATTHKKCIAHIDIALYEDVFSSIVQEARSASGGRRAAGTNGVGQSAFDHVPEWVQDRPRTATAHERSANGAASRDVDDRTTESYDSTSSPNYQEIQQANGADAGNQAQASQRADANGSRSNTVAGAQGHTYPSINHAYGQPGLLTTAPQIPGSNVLLASPPLHPHVMPMPAASHYMTMPQMYSQIDPRVQHHMLMHPMYSGNGAYGANAPNMAGPAYQDMYSNKSLQEAISRVLEILQEPKKDM